MRNLARKTKPKQPEGIWLAVSAGIVNFAQAFACLFIFTGIPALYQVVRGVARGLASHTPGAPDSNDLPILLGIPLIAGTVIGGMTLLIYLWDYVSERLRTGKTLNN